MDDDEQSVSSQGVGKASKRRPLSGRLSKRALGSSDDLAATSDRHVSDENERGMIRNSTAGRKVRTRSRSRSRGRAKNRTVTPEEGPPDAIPKPRRVRVHSTSRIVTEKTPMNAVRLTATKSSNSGHHVDNPNPQPRGGAGGGNIRGSKTLSGPALHIPHDQHPPMKPSIDQPHDPNHDGSHPHPSPPKSTLSGKPKSPAPWK